MNLAYRFPIIFWNCACLITDSGGNEDEEPVEEIVDIYEPEDFEEYEYIDAPDKKTKIKKKRAKTTDYKKIATAIGKMIQSGIKIVPPDINKSSYTFTPDIENNSISFGLSGMLNVGEDVITDTIANRPYTSPKDYLLRVKPKKQAMLSLIKAGAFDNMIDRKICMGWYLWETCDKKSNLTLQNMASLIKYNLLPTKTKEQVLAKRVYEFNRYLKTICENNKVFYYIDERAINFLIELNQEELIGQDDYDKFVISIKEWDKIYQSYMDIFRAWIAENKSKILSELNKVIFKEAWDNYAKGSLSAWEMEALCFYYHEHELINVNNEKYGIVNFFELNEEPMVERSFVKAGKTINMFKIYKICGTCIAKNKNKSFVTLLTPDGVVNVKFRKEYFSMFDKQISQKNPDGTKKILEHSWFNRGNMILVQGIRSGDNFVAKKYASSTLSHQLYKINGITNDGSLILQTDRIQSED